MVITKACMYMCFEGSALVQDVPFGATLTIGQDLPPLKQRLSKHHSTSISFGLLLALRDDVG